MATYDYKCKICGHVWEGVAKMNDPCPPCPREVGEGFSASQAMGKVLCGGETQKVFGAAPVHFHGSGWAKDGYENKNLNGLLKKNGMAT